MLESQHIQDESISKISEAVSEEMEGSFRKVFSQINALYKLVDNLSGSTSKIQKKLKSNTEVIEGELKKIANFIDEDRHLKFVELSRKQTLSKEKLMVP